MPGETVRAVWVQPDWLRVLRVQQRLPEGADVVFTGCGTAAGVEQALGLQEAMPAQTRICVAGAGDDWPTAQEAVLELGEGARVAAEAHEGEGRAAERARDAYR